MESTVNYFIEANLYLASLYLIYKGFIQPARNYKIARPFLIVGIILSIGLPFLTLQTMNVSSTELNLSLALAEVSISNTASPNDSVLTTLNWINVIYLFGMLSLLILFIVQLSQLLVVKAKATKKETHFELEQSTAAFSFMNWIFIGSDYSSEEKTVLLRHEQVHVTKKHSLDILLCQALKIAFWMNPLVYQFKTLFQEIHEYEADELSWHESDGYLQLLIQQNFNHFPALTNQFKSSHLKLRIMRLKNQFTKKITPAKVGLTMALFAATFFINQNLKAGEPQVRPADVEHVHSPSSDSVYSAVDVDKIAVFPGGQEAMLEFIGNNVVYPKSMKKQGITGRVYLQFTILEDGSITDLIALESRYVPHEELIQAAVNGIKQMPKWTPAEKDGKTVKIQFTLPINFKIPEESPPTPPTK